ncbi:choline dehydrogenase [soil metagenome]
MKYFTARIALILALFSHASDLNADTPNGCTADYIIVGGGTAGCVLAKLLQEIGTVLVCEDGKNQDTNPFITDPTLNGNLVLDATNLLFAPLGHATVQATPDNKRFPAVVGETLGGGSSVNGLQAVRGAPSTFVEWEAISGDSDWGPANDFAQYIAMETFNGVPGQFNPAAHGTSGPIDIRQAAKNVQAATQFSNALVALGYPFSPDYNDPATPVGSFLYWQLFEQPDGSRESSSTAYLEETLNQLSTDVYVSDNNRMILYTAAHVTKVLFSQKTGALPKAVGVQAIVNGQQQVFFARRKVILAAGFQTPLLLQLSGIGDATLLNNLQIPVIFDNANVGQHMLNHPIIVLTGTGTVPFPVNPDPNGLYDGGAQLPDPSVMSPDRAFELIGIATPPTAFTIATLILGAQSEGTINLLYSDPLRMPEYAFNYFMNAADLTSTEAAYGIMYNTLVQMGLTPLGPNPANTVAVEAYIFANYSQAYHWTGSCRMAQSAATGVVDSTGHVYGVQDLIVADITIIPVNPSGNTADPAFLVGNVIANKLIAAA